MKLLLLSEFFPKNHVFSGGVEARNYFLQKYCRGQTIVLTSRTGNFPNPVIAVGLPRRYLQVSLADLLKRFWYIAACVYQGIKIDFDVVDGSNFVTHVAAIILGALKHKQVVLWYADVWVGCWVKNLGAVGIFGEIMERMVLFFGKNAKFIAISEYTKNNLIKNNILAKNIVVIPLGVDEEEFKCVKTTAKKYDLICVNRLVAYKKTAEAVEAAAIHGYSLLVIGEGSEKENLKRIIKKYQAGRRIKILSNMNHSQIMQKIAAARLFVSASEVEGFGIAPMEAAALGLPCLLKNIAPYREHAANLGGCVLFERGELVKKIALLLEDRKKYQLLGAANQKNAGKFFWREVVRKTEELYAQK